MYDSAMYFTVTKGNVFSITGSEVDKFNSNGYTAYKAEHVPDSKLVLRISVRVGTSWQFLKDVDLASSEKDTSLQSIVQQSSVTDATEWLRRGAV